MDLEASELETRCLTPLGYLAKPSVSTVRTWCKTRPKASKLAQFMYICDAGRELKMGTWGNFDESLQFLGLGPEEFEVVASCNGVLLCCKPWENYEYFICNPVTRDFRILPSPKEKFSCVAIAFLCTGNSTSLDDVQYEVIRAKIADIRKFSKVLEIDTFSSFTNEWTEASLVCDSEFGLDYEVSFAIRDVIFFPTCNHALLAYDRSNQLIQLIEAPSEIDQDLRLGYDELFGKSGGKIQYLRSNEYDMETWELEYFEGAEKCWIMKHQVSFSEIRNQNPGICFGGEFSFTGFHPNKPHLVLACSWIVPYWYDTESRKLSVVFGFTSFGVPCNHFLFEYNVDSQRYDNDN